MKQRYVRVILNNLTLEASVYISVDRSIPDGYEIIMDYGKKSDTVLTSKSMRRRIYNLLKYIKNRDIIVENDDKQLDLFTEQVDNSLASYDASSITIQG